MPPNNEVRDIPAERAIRINNILLGVLITVILGVGGFLTNSVESLRGAVGDINDKMSGIFSMTQVNEVRIGNLERRVDKIEDQGRR